MSGVEQQDREAAAAILYPATHESISAVREWKAMRDGEADTHPWIQAFARHRHEARKAGMEEAAGIAGSYEGALKPAPDWSEAEGTWYETGVLDASLGIRAAIRSAIGGE